MRNFLKISLVAAVLFTSLSAIANDDILVKAKSENEKSIVFMVDDAQDINMSIISQDDEVVYEQRVRTAGTVKKIYNLDAFPNGNYTLKLESALKLTTYQILIENGRAQLSAPTIKVLFKPVIAKEKGLITLDLKTVVDSPVGIVVLNEYNEELINNEMAKGKSIQKFDVTATNARELTFIVKYKDQEHIETVKIR
jgi:hypothetical protein